MIKEEYVSLEVAKLLKDKGFNEPTIGTYNIESKNPILVERPIRAIHCEAIISAPTQAMVMMWLREVHNISIEPLVDFGSGDKYWWTADIGYIKKDGLIDELCGYDSYEEACEAAIKYCLENLI